MAVFNNYISMDYLYKVALEEGEGFGTAYEYFTKINLFKRLLREKQIESILIAGLPEKYGFGLDFFILAQICKSRIFIIDDRREVIDKAIKIIASLKQKNLLLLDKVEFKKINAWGQFSPPEKFSLVASSGMIQRISNKERINYIDLLCAAADDVVIFAPNAGNINHLKITGLQSINKGDIKIWCGYFKRQINEKKIGLIDMPPFPPGIKNNMYLRGKKGLIAKFICRVLEFWSYFDSFLPEFFKSRFSHIVYLYASFHPLALNDKL